MTIQIKLRYTITLLILVMVIATIYYNYTEHWGIIDSVYFTVKTATTVGYGDVVPTHTGSKIFTIFFMIISTGLTLYSVGLLAQQKILIHLDRHSKKIVEQIDRAKDETEIKPSDVSSQSPPSSDPKQ